MLEQKNQPTYIVNFYGNIEQKSILYRKKKKYYRPAFVKKIAQCRLENINCDYLTTDVLSSQSLNNIWMMSIRKCSIGVTR